MKVFLLTLLICPVFFSLVLEFSSRVVLGKLLSKQFLDRFFTKNWENYAQSATDGKDLIYSNGGFFISTSGCPTSKWYLSGLGRIPRWSKWSTKIDVLHKELNEKYWTDFNKKYL